MSTKTWNNNLYSRILTGIYTQGYFLDETIEKKDTLYRKLAKELDVSYDSIKGWAREQSNGPSNPKVVERLEELLGAKLTTCKESVVNEERKETKMYSDFVKTNIKKCYDMMMDYLLSDDVDNEEVYCSMRMEIGKMSVCIPDEIYSKITEFVDNNLEPIIYDHDNYFSELYTEEIGYYDEEHRFCMKDENATRKFLGLYLQKIFEIKTNLEQFGKKELYPILIQ